MLQALGLALVVLVVFGALATSGGHAVAEALPFEIALIGGAGLGVLLLGNAPGVAAEALTGFVRAFRGPRWRRRDYTSLLSCLHALMARARRDGVLAVETDIDAPETSPLFAAAPALGRDAALTDMICATFRQTAFGGADKARAKEGLDRAMAAEIDARKRAVAALHALADALPALGIVAAVIGIIRAMSAIDGPPELLGPMIAAALLGTLLGVALSYGFVSPIATRYDQVIEADFARFDAARAALSAYLDGASPTAAIEHARSGLASDVRPDEQDVVLASQALRFISSEAKAA